jgi:hypothetical protein
MITLEGFDILSEIMPLGRPRRRWQNYINIFLKAIGWGIAACNTVATVFCRAKPYFP